MFTMKINNLNIKKRPSYMEKIIYFQIKVDKTGTCINDSCKLAKPPREFSRQTVILELVFRNQLGVVYMRK